jgi:hypothetical protein
VAVEKGAVGKGEAGGRLLRRRHGDSSFWRIGRKLRGEDRRVKGGSEKDYALESKI